MAAGPIKSNRKTFNTKNNLKYEITKRRSTRNS